MRRKAYLTTDQGSDQSRLALSIDEFCKAHGFSRATYFIERQRGHGPREMRVGNRVLISQEAAADWRRDRETSVEAQ
jgi:hypothetical protein